MPNIADHHSAQTYKGIHIGNSGTGKTGALCSLAENFNLRILDYDNGVDIIRTTLLDSRSGYKAEWTKNVDYVSLREKKQIKGGKYVPTTATVWQKTADMLHEWKDGEKNLGSVLTWTPNDILVFDSLTMLSTSALRFILAMNGRLGAHPYESDWGDAQELVKNLLEMLTDDAVKCNVIINCHIKFIERRIAGTIADPKGGNTMLMAYPNTLGKALPPDVGRNFNNALYFAQHGQGSLAKRKIFTSPQGMVDVKTSAPFALANEYSINTGLAEIFKIVRAAPAAPKP